MKKPIPNFFIVEGNIGAGKSTFLAKLKKELFFDIIYEPCKQWQHVGGTYNVLDAYYKDPHRWSYSFQSYVLITRLEEQRKGLLQSSSPTQIMERSIFSDRFCFAKVNYENGYMNALEWRLYQDGFSLITQRYPCYPTGFIYMQTDPEVCFGRLKKRNRFEEKGITLGYLRSIHEKHESIMIRNRSLIPDLKDIPVLILPCNDEFEEDAIVLRKHINTLTSFIVKYSRPFTKNQRESFSSL
jgi:deoxyadenosine/deoxycytidine kinase